MKILEIINVDFALAQFLLPLLREARAQGHNITAVCAGGPWLDPVRAEGFRVIELPLPRSLSPAKLTRAFKSLLRLIREEAPDLVHAHMPISGVLARFAARAAGVPKIAYTCHGFLFNQPSSFWRRALGYTAEFAAARCTDIFLTVSAEEALDAKRLLLVGNPIPIGNGADPTRYHPNPETRARIRAELGTPGHRPVILIASRQVRHKGYPELLAAMAQVDAELWVAGGRLESDHGESMEPYFQASHATIRRLGWRQDMPDLLAAADIFVLPSHFEGLPLSIIEAMMTAIPIVTTNIKGCRELVTDSLNGFLVPPGDATSLATALNRLATNPSLRHRMGLAAREIALARYDQTTVARRTLDLLTASG